MQRRRAWEEDEQRVRGADVWGLQRVVVLRGAGERVGERLGRELGRTHIRKQVGGVELGLLGRLGPFLFLFYSNLLSISFFIWFLVRNGFI